MHLIEIYTSFFGKTHLLPLQKAHSHTIDTQTIRQEEEDQDPVIQNRYFLNVFVWIALTEMRRRRKALVVLVIRRLLTCAICIIALLGFLTVHIYVAPLNRLPRLHLNKHTTRVRNQSLISQEDFDIFFKTHDRFCHKARIVLQS